MEPKIDKQGRITIPAEVRRDLDLHSGDRVRFEKRAEGLVIKKELTSPVLQGFRNP